MSRLPISMNRPDGASVERLFPIASPDSELRTTSTPSPFVRSRISSAKASVRESKISSTPRERRYVALLRGAGGGEDLRAEVACDLDRGQADAAGGRVDEDALSRLQPGQLHERDVRRDERDRHGGRLLEIERRRLGQDELGSAW